MVRLRENRMPPKKKAAAKCDDIDNPKQCDDGELCKVQTHRCVKDTPANRKGMVTLKYKGNTIVGTPELIDEFAKAAGIRRKPSPAEAKPVKKVKKTASPVKAPTPPAPKKGKAKKPKSRGCIDDGCADGEVCDTATQACVADEPANKAGRKVLKLPDGRKLVGTVEILGPIKEAVGGTYLKVPASKMPKPKTPTPKPKKAAKAKKGVKCIDEPCDDDKLCNVSTGRCIADTTKNKAGKKILRLDDGRRLIGDAAILDPIKAAMGGKYLKATGSVADDAAAAKPKAVVKKGKKAIPKCAEPTEPDCSDTGQYCDVESGACVDYDEKVDLYYTDLPSGRRVSGKEELVRALAMTFGTEVHVQKAKKGKAKKATPAKKGKAKAVADEELVSAPRPSKGKKAAPSSCTDLDNYLTCGPDEACDAAGACVPGDAAYTTAKHTLTTKDGRTIYGDAVALQKLQATLGGTIKQPVKAGVVQPPTALGDARAAIYKAFAECIRTL